MFRTRMSRGGPARIRPLVGPLAMSTLVVAGIFVPLASTSAGASLSSSSASSGDWPGVGKICGPGPGGTSSVRGVGNKTINVQGSHTETIQSDRNITVTAGNRNHLSAMSRQRSNKRCADTRGPPRHDGNPPG